DAESSPPCSGNVRQCSWGFTKALCSINTEHLRAVPFESFAWEQREEADHQARAADRVHTYGPVIRARGQLERLSMIDREQLETNLLGPGMWGPQTSWRTLLPRPSDVTLGDKPLVDEDMAVGQGQVSDAIGYAEWRQSSGTTQRDMKSKHMIPLVLMLAA
ncbi:hypothetical protein D6D01_01330, partial [Aureobasidium pullulans]